MKKRAALMLLLAVLLALPAAAHAQRPATITLGLEDVSFASPHRLEVRKTEAGWLVTAIGMQGEATVVCIEGDCSVLDGKQLEIQQDLQIMIEHTAAGFKAAGRARGSLYDWGRISHLGGFVGRVNGTADPDPASGQIGLELEETGQVLPHLTGYLNDRIRELNKFQLSLSGTIVSQDGVWWLVGLEGDGTLSQIVIEHPGAG